MTHRLTAPILLLTLLLSGLLFSPLAQADPLRSVRSSAPVAGTKTADAVAVDVTGFMEWPRGDSRVRWQPPARFQRNTDLVFGLSLKGEVLRPVDRDGLRRAMGVQRALTQVGR